KERVERPGWRPLWLRCSATRFRPPSIWKTQIRIAISIMFPTSAARNTSSTQFVIASHSGRRILPWCYEASHSSIKVGRREGPNGNQFQPQSTKVRRGKPHGSKLVVKEAAALALLFLSRRRNGDR